MFHVQCQGCGAWTLVAPGPCVCDSGHPGLCSGQFHEALDAQGTCGCCPEDHSHRLATIETGVPCRPITVSALESIAPVTGG